MDRSNLGINSNVYPVTESQVIKDRGLINQIKDRKTLRKLVENILGPIRDDEYCRKLLAGLMDPHTLRVYWDEDVGCAYANGQKTFGLVKDGDHMKIECRCKNTCCRFYKSCRPN